MSMIVCFDVQTLLLLSMCTLRCDMLWHIECCIVASSFFAGLSVHGMQSTPQKDGCVNKRRKILYDPAIVSKGKVVYHKYAKTTTPVAEGTQANNMVQFWLWFHHMFASYSGKRKSRFLRNLKRMIFSISFSGMGGAEVLMFLFVLVVNGWLTEKIDPIRCR